MELILKYWLLNQYQDGDGDNFQWILFLNLKLNFIFDSSFFIDLLAKIYVEFQFANRLPAALKRRNIKYNYLINIIYIS